MFGTYQGTERNLCDTRQRLISKCAPKSVLSSALISIFQRLQAPGDGKICNLMCFNVSWCSTGTLAPSANCATRASGLCHKARAGVCGFLHIKAEKHTFFHALCETSLWWGSLRLRSVCLIPLEHQDTSKHSRLHIIPSPGACKRPKWTTMNLYVIAQLWRFFLSAII